MGLRENLRKAASLFIEVSPESAEPDVAVPLAENGPSVEMVSPPKPATKTIGELAHETAGPALDEVQVEKPSSIIKADGGIEFSLIYQTAGLPAVPFSAEQMLDVLASLPAELPLETKRQTVKATVQAMGKSLGVTPEGVVTDATRKLAALTVYVENLAKHTTAFVTATELEIATLQVQIADKRKAIDDSQKTLTDITTRCTAESDRIDDLVEFFSLDIAPSKYAPKK